MQKNIVIADASCLILLEKLEMLDILYQLFEQITITTTIADEFGKDLPKWIGIIDPIDKILESSVDKGEASSIVLALEMPQCLLIIDDIKGRRVASGFGINITGTLGVLVNAKNEGIITLIKPVPRKIRLTNFRFSKDLEIEILRQAGE